MSTNSILAIMDGDDEWKGRYCHSDGYPTWNGRVIWNEVKAAGYEAYESFLTDGRGTHGISTISPGFLTDPREESWSDKYGTGNFKVYQDRPGEEGALAMWVSNEPRDFVYVVTPTEMVVRKGGYVRSCPFDRAEPDWAKIDEEAYQ